LAALSNSTWITPDFIALLEFEIEQTEADYRVARVGVRLLLTGCWGVMGLGGSAAASTTRFAATVTM